MQLPVVVKLSGAAQKISQLQTPDDNTLEFVTVKGCDKIFVHGAQLAVACGYPNQAGTTADNTDFAKAVNAVAKFYAVRRNESDTKARRFVVVKDVPAVLQEFSFNRTRDQKRCETTVELLRWWLDERPTNSQPTELVTRPDERPTNSQPTELVTRPDERPTNSRPHAKEVDVLETINARAELLMKNFGALRRDGRFRSGGTVGVPRDVSAA